MLRKNLRHTLPVAAVLTLAPIAGLSAELDLRGAQQRSNP
jgi:hypothetical protein